ncbi:MAG: TRAP transporter large permease subunit [Ectothiorhodospiraceae bacterium]|nr:TRAP transporter large permease subunit [Chromatiales bacterium]MCP5154101.1 TRAP transporter large permease subunit [Ectothiorhodospiraceae bacterium]
MSPEAVAVCALFLCAFAAVLAGIPVAFALSGAALAVAGVADLVGLFDLAFLGAIPSRIFGTAMFNEVLTAVPLFILMGVVLERSRIAEDLLTKMAVLFGGLRGGLGISVTLVGTLLAASTGIVAATVVAMGLLSLPAMLKRGYDRPLACGVICASGTLGQIIPPSIVLVFLGDQLSGAYMEAQREVGNYAPDPLSVGDLFAGALIPGLLLAGGYVLYLVTMAALKPETCPPIPLAERRERVSPAELVRTLVAPIVLVVSVLGSILTGIATPTEAAGIGALGAILLASLRLAADGGDPRGGRVVLAGFAAVALLPLLRLAGDLRLGRDDATTTDTVLIAVAMVALTVAAAATLTAAVMLARRGVLRPAFESTMRLCALAFSILIGATIFSLVFRGLGGDDLVLALMEDIPGGVHGAVLAVMAVVFLLGFFLDFIEIVFIVMPIVAPVILRSDIDPVWFGVLLAINLQTSFLTPPFGFSLFYLRGVAPPEITTGHIYRGVAPFIVIQLGVLALVGFWPQVATWLPHWIYG